MTTLAEAAEALKEVRRKEGLTQGELADRAGLARSTVTRLETLAQGDVGLSAFLRLLAAAGYDMKVVKAGHVRTLKDILAEQRAPTETPK
jgi:transcriptional regulator with XRE-family HTH domain